MHQDYIDNLLLICLINKFYNLYLKILRIEN